MNVFALSLLAHHEESRVPISVLRGVAGSEYKLFMAGYFIHLTFSNASEAASAFRTPRHPMLSQDSKYGIPFPRDSSFLVTGGGKHEQWGSNDVLLEVVWCSMNEVPCDRGGQAAGWLS